MRAKLARSGGFQPIESLESRLLFSNLPPLLPPTGFGAVPRTSTTAVLGWDPEFVVGETGFLIERSTDGDNWATAIIAPANSRAWIDSNLEPNTTYFYRIAAFSDTETSLAEFGAIITTPANTSADVDQFGTLFIRRTAGTDVVQVEQQFGLIDVDVGADTDTFLDGQVDRIRVLQSDTDNGMTIDRIFIPSNNGIIASNALTVRGTVGNDVIGISGNVDFIHVKVNGAVLSFSRTLVNRINVLSYDGDDRISITDEVGAVNVNAGLGNDVIFSGAGDDRLNGGPGDDLIKGNAGNDVIIGDTGNDTAYGQAGNDFLQGNDGNDRLIGGIGNDLLHGNNGSDRLYGEEGVDVLLGGTGFNFLKQD